MATATKREDLKLLGMSALILALSYSFLPDSAKDKLFSGHLDQKIETTAQNSCWEQFNRKALPLQEDFIVPMDRINSCYHQTVATLQERKNAFNGEDMILYLGSGVFGLFGLWGVASSSQNLIRRRKENPAPKP